MQTVQAEVTTNGVGPLGVRGAWVGRKRWLALVTTGVGLGVAAGPAIAGTDPPLPSAFATGPPWAATPLTAAPLHVDGSSPIAVASGGGVDWAVTSTGGAGPNATIALRLFRSVSPGVWRPVTSRRFGNKPALPATAVNAVGGAAAVWFSANTGTRGVVTVATRSAGGGWSRASALSGLIDGTVRMSLGSDGGVAVAWNESVPSAGLGASAVRVALGSVKRPGTWRVSKPIMSRFPTDRLALLTSLSGGRTVAVWAVLRNGDYYGRSASIGPTGRVTVLTSPAGGGRTNLFSLARSSKNTLHVAWMNRLDGDVSLRFARLNGTTWSTPETVVRRKVTAGFVTDPRLVGSGGHAALAWSEPLDDPTNPGSATFTVRVATRLPGGGWTLLPDATPSPLSPPASSRLLSLVDVPGGWVLAWASASRLRSGASLLTRSIRTDGLLGAVSSLTDFEGNTSAFDSYVSMARQPSGGFIAAAAGHATLASPITVRIGRAGADAGP